MTAKTYKDYLYQQYVLTL